MKKTPVKTEEQRERDIRFIRRGPVKLRKHKKLINGRVTKEDLVLLISALWKGFGTIKIKYSRVNDNHRVEKITKRKYKNIPPSGRLNRYSRNVLTGIYGSHLDLARKEGLLDA